MSVGSRCGSFIPEMEAPPTAELLAIARSSALFARLNLERVRRSATHGIRDANCPFWGSGGNHVGVTDCSRRTSRRSVDGDIECIEGL